MGLLRAEPLKSAAQLLASKWELPGLGTEVRIPLDPAFNPLPRLGQASHAPASSLPSLLPHYALPITPPACCLLQAPVPAQKADLIFGPPGLGDTARRCTGMCVDHTGQHTQGSDTTTGKNCGNLGIFKYHIRYRSMQNLMQSAMKQTTLNYLYPIKKLYRNHQEKNHNCLM